MAAPASASSTSAALHKAAPTAASPSSPLPSPPVAPPEYRMSLPVFLGAHSGTYPPPHAFASASAAAAPDATVMVVEAPEPSAPTLPIFAPDLVIDCLGTFIIQSHLATRPNWYNHFHTLWTYLQPRLAQYILAHYFSLHEALEAIGNLAQRIYDEGFAQLRILNNETQPIFTAFKNGKRKKIKITDFVWLIGSDGLFQPFDCARGEACSWKHLQDVPEVIKLESSYGVHLDWRNQRTHLLHVQIFDFIKGRDLFDRGDNLKFPQDLVQALDWMAQLLIIVQKVHRKKCAHRDLKMENVLVKEDGRLVLIDQDFVIQLSDNGMTSSPRGTSAYCSTQRLKNRSDGSPYLAFAEDLYSLGVVCYSLFTQCQFNADPFKDKPCKNEDELQQYLQTVWYPRNIEICERVLTMQGIPTQFIPLLTQIITGLTAADPNSRMSLETCLEIVGKMKMEAETLKKVEADGDASASDPTS